MHSIRVPESIIVILVLHSLSAILTLILAIRDRFEVTMLVPWTLMGFIAGPMGVVSRARLDRTRVGYAQVLQDMILSLGLELFATDVMPRFLIF